MAPNAHLPPPLAPVSKRSLTPVPKQPLAPAPKRPLVPAPKRPHAPAPKRCPLVPVPKRGGPSPPLVPSLPPGRTAVLQHNSEYLYKGLKKGDIVKYQGPVDADRGKLFKVISSNGSKKTNPSYKLERYNAPWYPLKHNGGQLQETVARRQSTLILVVLA